MRMGLRLLVVTSILIVTAGAASPMAPAFGAAVQSVNYAALYSWTGNGFVGHRVFTPPAGHVNGGCFGLADTNRFGPYHSFHNISSGVAAQLFEFANCKGRDMGWAYPYEYKQTCSTCHVRSVYFIPYCYCGSKRQIRSTPPAPSTGTNLRRS
ncbi:hypothetical protein [Fodinicola feengrottensis]|uniref:Uncharacterized protein n=1 Tax=Fodinicola feengrottensis TaxID=435914 RepID=A0ABN2GMW8_9ACTN|nr:hypothetical protein [Fodinicola feengrottensis]